MKRKRARARNRRAMRTRDVAFAARSFRELKMDSGTREGRTREANGLGFVDKAFGCCWLDAASAMVSTKCNKLFEVEIDRRRSSARGRFREVEIGRENVARGPVTRSMGRSITGPRSLVATWARGVIGASLDVGDDLVPVVAPCGRRSGGAHAVVCSELREHVLCSGGPDHDVVSFARDVDTDALVPRLALRGHEDVVFGIDFCSRDTAATCSRDGTVKIWRLPRVSDVTEYDYIACAKSIVPHPSCGIQNERIRGVKSVGNHLATVSSGGVVHQLDIEHGMNGGLVRMYPFPGYLETSCIATNGRTVVVGSRTHVGFADFRERRLHASVALPFDDMNSVRSLSWITQSSHLLTFGGGRGTIYFYDERVRRYLNNEQGFVHELHNADLCVPLSAEDEERLAFDDMSRACLLPAILAHQWDDSGRLLVAGGPLQALLSGFFMGIWS